MIEIYGALIGRRRQSGAKCPDPRWRLEANPHLNFRLAQGQSRDDRLTLPVQRASDEC